MEKNYGVGGLLRNSKRGITYSFWGVLWPIHHLFYGLCANNDPKNSWHQPPKAASVASADLFRCGRPSMHQCIFWQNTLEILSNRRGYKYESKRWQLFLYRWRKRNHLSYLRTKSNYEAAVTSTGLAATLPPERLSEHPLIYDDANIHFYRTSGTSTYLLDSSRGPSRSTMVRDISSLSSQVNKTKDPFSLMN